ncbi:transmembrane protease serine 11C-like [Neocloeon triangulifer]|uniref:transmembrane protease serine 11C-like n=1 Tax=Neocloeon triangulifer TaxID=2078957 RepID=UPI00286EEB87|nr:transmembrane protease serine 11C-like [Neocloeon triangulifer]
MDSAYWIFILAICSYRSSAQQMRVEKFVKIKMKYCWNYEKRTSIFETPVFSYAGNDNLSFNNCGRWEQTKAGSNPPWDVFLVAVIDERLRKLYGALVSDQTIISDGSTWDAGHFKAIERKEQVKIYGGECRERSDGNSCFIKRGLTNLKMLDVKEVELKHGEFYSKSLLVIRIERVEFKPSLQPICLWNRGNQDDTSQNFYSQDIWNYKLKKVDFLPEQRCFYSGPGSEIQKQYCDAYSNSICTSRSWVDEKIFLYIERLDRFYLRAFNPFLSGASTEPWVDLLPFTNQIVSASADLAAMPKIPDLKRKIDFGQRQSFPGCGQKSGENSNPWHAIISRIDPIHEGFCGATLISEKTLVTAANCLYDQRGTEMEASNLKITLGLHSSSKNHEDSQQNIMVSSIIVHPEFNFNKSDLKSDIALIILQNKAQLIEQVVPICLWNDEYDLSKIVDTTGTVVGWVRNDSLQEVQIQPIYYQQCYESNRPFFSKYLHPRENFCAGFPHNKTGACIGENGSGFVIEKDNRFFLRGTKSVPVDVGGEEEEVKTCNPQHFALFTDVTNFLKWIVDNKR